MRAANKIGSLSVSESESESISTAALLATVQFLGIAGQKVYPSRFSWKIQIEKSKNCIYGKVFA